MKYLAIANTRLMGSLIYERDVLMQSVLMLVALVTFVQLWTTTYVTTNQAIVDGYDLRDLVWYLVITEVVGLSTPRLADKIDLDVRSGDIAYALARPYNYPLYHLAGYWGETLLRVPINALVGGAVALVAVGLPPTNLAGVLATLLLGAGAITLKAMLGILIGLSAFWVEDTQPAEWIYNKFLLTIGGLFLPLELFPDWLASIARTLPFASIAYAPARVFVGFSWPVFGSLLLTQLIWLGVCWFSIHLLFGLASRRLVAHGG
jgi:viologen exporter family transport system permease protein